MCAMLKINHFESFKFQIGGKFSKLETLIKLEDIEILIERTSMILNIFTIYQSGHHKITSKTYYQKVKNDLEIVIFSNFLIQN
jgi:hypothetical protein